MRVVVAPDTGTSRGNDFWVLGFPLQTIRVINMIPNSLSAETNQDSEPNIAVNPALCVNTIIRIKLFFRLSIEKIKCAKRGKPCWFVVRDRRSYPATRLSQNPCAYFGPSVTIRKRRREPICNSLFPVLPCCHHDDRESAAFRQMENLKNRWLVVASDGAWKFSQTWLWLSSLLYVAAIGISHGVMRPGTKRIQDLMIEMEQGPPPAGGAPPQVARIQKVGKVTRSVPANRSRLPRRTSSNSASRSAQGR